MIYLMVAELFIFLTDMTYNRATSRCWHIYDDRDATIIQELCRLFTSFVSLRCWRYIDMNSVELHSILPAPRTPLEDSKAVVSTTDCTFCMGASTDTKSIVGSRERAFQVIMSQVKSRVTCYLSSCKSSTR